MSDFLRFKPTDVGIRTQARLKGKFTSFQAQALRANEQAVNQMAKWAVEELNRHMRRPEGGHTGTLERAILDPTTHRATVDGFTFMLGEEMDAKVINPTPYTDKDGIVRHRRGTYWRAIEEGSYASVGRILPLEFMDPRGRRRIQPDGARAQKEINSRGNEGEDYRILNEHRGLPDGSFVGGMDRYRYSRHRNVRVTIRTKSGLKSFVGRRRPTIEVRNPIRPYHYAQAAVLKFEAGDYAYYKGLLLREAQRSGLKLVFT